MKDEGEDRSMSRGVTSKRSERPSEADVPRPTDTPWEPKIVAFLVQLVQLRRGRPGRHEPDPVSSQHTYHPRALQRED